MNQEQQGANGPGIVVLSSSLQVLHMNRRAMALLTQLERTAQSIGPEPAVAAPLHQHCQDIVETLQARLRSNNWEQFHQYRTIGDSTHSIFLNGFGLPDRRGLPHSRIVMLLSPTPQPRCRESGKWNPPTGSSRATTSVQTLRMQSHITGC